MFIQEQEDGTSPISAADLAQEGGHRLLPLVSAGHQKTMAALEIDGPEERPLGVASGNRHYCPLAHRSPCAAQNREKSPERFILGHHNCMGGPSFQAANNGPFF